MQQRLPQQQSSGGADLNGAPRVSFKLTWRYNQVGKNQKKNVSSFFPTTTTTTTAFTPAQSLSFFSVNLLINPKNNKLFSLYFFFNLFIIFWVWKTLCVYTSIWSACCVLASASALTTGGFGFSLFFFVCCVFFLCTSSPLWSDIDAILTDLAISLFFLVPFIHHPGSALTVVC